MPDTGQLTVTALNIYPLKGCRGVPVQKAKVHPTGFYFDRHWLIASEDRGRFQSQRSDPKMALIEVSLPPEAFTDDPETLPDDAVMTLRAPGLSELKVRLRAPSDPTALRDCVVWEWKGKALDEGEYAADWLSEYLGKPVRLLRYAGDQQQNDDSAQVKRVLDAQFADGHVAFADGYPFLLATEESLKDLNTKLEEQIKMNRFRPNIVVSGGAAWEEDQWQALQIGSLNLSAVKPCDRCKVTTTDQATAEVSKEREPLRTLQTFRKGSVLGWTRVPQWKAGVFFGWNLVPEGNGLLSVGDAVQITKQRSGLAGLQ